MKLFAKLIALMASLAGEADPAKRAALSATISKKSAKLSAKAKAGDDDPDDDDDDEGGEEESRAQKAAEKAEKAKKAAEAAKHRAKRAEYLKKAEEAEEAAKSAEEDDEEEEESEEEEAKAALAAVQALTGMRGKAALGALQSLANVQATVVKDVAALKASTTASAKAALIDGARKAGRITKAEASWLADQPAKTAEGFVAMREKAGLVLTDEESLIKPKHTQPGTEAALPAETLEMIESAVNVWTGDKKAYRESLVQAHLAAHAKQVRAALDGAGRY